MRHVRRAMPLQRPSGAKTSFSSLPLSARNSSTTNNNNNQSNQF